MIPITELRVSIEKTASPVGNAVLKTFKFIGKHPWLTIGTATGATLAAKGILSAAEKIHPLHQIYREETKNKILKDQRSLLQQMVESKKEKPITGLKQKLSIPPLT